MDDAVTGVGRRPDSTIPGQTGSGLIELMISAAISLALVAALAGMTVASSSTYQTMVNYASIQENARFAVAHISRHLRMAGYRGCGAASTHLTSNLTRQADGSLYDVRFFLEGVDVDSGRWQPSGGDASVLERVAGTDAITVRFATPSDGAALESAAARADDLDTDGDGIFSRGSVVLISDCAKGDVFQVSNSPGIDGILKHEAGATDPGNRTAELGGIPGAEYEAGSSVARFTAVRYYVRQREPDDAASPVALYRSYLSGSGSIVNQELVEGVEHLRILYGEDTTGDGVADDFRNADSVNDWRQIAAVRIGMVVRANREHGAAGEQRTDSLDVLGTPFPPQPGHCPAPEDQRQAWQGCFQRNVYTFTTAIRNPL